MRAHLHCSQVAALGKSLVGEKTQVYTSEPYWRQWFLPWASLVAQAVKNLASMWETGI